MNPTIERFSRLYAKLTYLYPYDFRCVFANEMQAVLNEKLFARSKTGNLSLWRDFWEELRSLPVAILREYWFAFREILGKGIMTLITEDKSWRIDNRRDAFIASLPPVMMGFGIALGALIVWEPWYTIPYWRLITGFALVLLPGLIIGLGGFLP